MDILGNLAGIGIFLLFQLCGICAALSALKAESATVRMLFGSVCGSVMLQWFPVIFAFFFDFTVIAHILGLLLAVLCAAFALWRGKPSLNELKGFKNIFNHKFLLVALVVWGFYCFLVWKSFLFEDGKIFSSQATYGDMSMHLSFITSLTRQGTFPPDYSLLPGTRLSYPFLSDSISSSLYLFGASLKIAYTVPMWCAGAQVMLGFYLFVYRLLGSRMKVAFSWLFFFFNGGLGFLYFLGGEEGNFSRIFTAFYQTPTNLVEENIRWVNVIVDMMLPQRATLFGWAVLFPTLYLLCRAVFEKKERYFLLAGILAGAMPMIHTHSFLALAMICAAWLTASLLQKLEKDEPAVLVGKIAVVMGIPVMCCLQLAFDKYRLDDSEKLLWFACAVLGAFVLFLIVLLIISIKKEGFSPLLRTWGALLLIVCVLALPQLFFWTFRQAGSGSFVRGHFAWVVGEDNYALFYLKNIGLVAVLGFIALICAKKESFAKYSPILLIWFVAEFIEFQPNDYDNNKLLYVAYALLCCAAAELLWDVLCKLKNKGLRACIATAVLAVSTVSAVLTMGREAVAKYELFGEGALHLCNYVERNIEPDAIILTDMRHNNEIASLTGRNIVCGSSSYLFFHGLYFYPNEQAARAMYEEPWNSLELFENYGVDYVLLSDFERNSYEVNKEWLDYLFEIVYDDGSRVLYKVS